MGRTKKSGGINIGSSILKDRNRKIKKKFSDVLF
jgi:hypothetical protein